MSTANELVCDNCGVRHGADDIFCENCGYDFITGSLPGPAEQFTPTASETSASGSLFDPPAPPTRPGTTLSAVRFEVAPDRAYFQTVVAEGELSFPDPAPALQTVELAGAELHVGRTSQSKAIHPDLDIAALTGDPAVSSRHAVIRIDAVGAITVTDVGSTNGTYVGSPSSPAITPGTPTSVGYDTPIYLGAWTRLVVLAPAIV